MAVKAQALGVAELVAAELRALADVIPGEGSAPAASLADKVLALEDLFSLVIVIFPRKLDSLFLEIRGGGHLDLSQPKSRAA